MPRHVLSCTSKACPSHRGGQRSEALAQVSPLPLLCWWLTGHSPTAGSCPALPSHVCTPVIAEGLGNALPAASLELFSQRGDVGWHICTIMVLAVRRGQCQRCSRVLSLETGRGELVESLSEQRSGLRAAAGGDAWPWVPGAGQREPGCTGRSGAVARWRQGFRLTSFPSAGWCMWPVVPVLCPSDACIPPVTLQVTQMRVDVTVEVPPWRRADCRHFLPSLDVLLGCGSAGGTQQVLQQR